MAYRERVLLLYRHALKQTLHWSFEREVFFKEAAKLREAFEQNRHLTEARHIRGLLTRGEAKLAAESHPDPYIVPYYVGGSLYARNPPWQEGLTQYLDFGREGYH